MTSNRTETVIEPVFDNTQPIVDSLLGRSIVRIEYFGDGPRGIGKAIVVLDGGTDIILEGHIGDIARDMLLGLPIKHTEESLDPTPVWEPDWWYLEYMKERGEMFEEELMDLYKNLYTDRK